MNTNLNKDSSNLGIKSVPEWNLNDLYCGIDDKKIRSDLEKIKIFTGAFCEKYHEKIDKLYKENKLFLVNAVSEYEQICELIAKISCYAYLNKAKHSSDSEIAIFYQNLIDEISLIEIKLIFFTLEIKILDESDLFLIINSNDALKHYFSWFKKIFRFKKYYLSDNEEKILHLKSTTSSSLLVRLFDELHTDLRFELNGDMLSDNEIFNYLSSKNENERHDAALSISKTLKNNGKLLSMILNMTAKDKSIEDDLRGFKAPIESKNLMNDIDNEIVENLIESVKEKYKSIPNRYYKLKAGWLKKDKLEFWDRNAPLPNVTNRIFSWNEAKEIVLKSFNKFSSVFSAEAKKFFDNGWIDAKIIPGKTSGAFCHPCTPGVHPYMLMNFHGKVYDIMTLSHELGHCVHYMLSKDNGYLSSDIPLTFAETASVFAEQLTFRYLLDIETEKSIKKSLIAKKVEDMINTVFRQIAFVDFEIRVHNKRLESELSESEICDIWMETQKEVLGDYVNLTDEYRYYWSYISHFIHSPFYVYAYAFGDCLVNSLYKNYLKNEHNFADKYLTLLSKGGTEGYRELLCPFNFDLTNKSFWSDGLKMIEELIDSLEEMS